MARASLEVQLSLNTKELKQTQKGIQSIEERLEALDNVEALDGVLDDIQQLSKQLGSLDKAFSGVEGGLSDTEQQLQRLTRNYQSQLTDLERIVRAARERNSIEIDRSGVRIAERRVDLLEQETRELEDQIDVIQRRNRISQTSTSDTVVEAQGDVSSAAGALAGVLGAGGGNVGQEAVAFTGDIFGFVEFIPRAREGIRTLTDNLRSQTNIYGQLTDQVLSFGSQFTSIIGEKLGGTFERAGNLSSKLTTAVTALSTSAAAAAGGTGTLTGAVVGLAVSTTALLAALAPVVIALGAAAKAVDAFIRDTKRLRNALDASVDAQVEYYELIETASADQIQAAIKEQQTAINARRQTLENLEAAREAQTLFQRVLGDIFLGQRGQIRDLEEELVGLEAQQDAYNRALEDTTVASEQATQALEQLNQSIVNQVGTIAREIVNNAALVENATTDQIEQQISSLQQQQAAARAEIEALTQLDTEEARQKIIELNGALVDLERQENNLINSVLPLVEAREREAQAVEAVNQAFEDFNNTTRDLERISQQRVEITEQTNERLTALDRRRADFLEQHERELARIREQRRRQDELRERRNNERREKLAEQRDENIINLREKFSDQLVELEQERNETRERVLKEHRQTIEDINRRAEESLEDAAASFDGLALQEAQRAREKELKEAQENLKDRAQEERENFTEREEELRNALDEALKLEQENYNKRRAELEEAIQKENADIAEQRAYEDEQRKLAFEQRRNDLEEQLAEERARIIEAQQQRLEDLDRHEAEILARRKQAQQEIEDNIQDSLDSIVNATEEAFNDISDIVSEFSETENAAGQNPGAPSAGGVTAFARGGDVTSTGMALVHQGERVLTSQTSSMLRSVMGPTFSEQSLLNRVGGVTIAPGAIVVSGNNPDLIAQRVMAELMRQLRGT